jgi:hypothetical protein
VNTKTLSSRTGSGFTQLTRNAYNNPALADQCDGDGIGELLEPPARV